MRLAGYLNAIIENSFAIPVYKDANNEYYFHSVDDNYKIKSFYKAELNEKNFNKCFLSIDFKIDNYGAYVFVGKDNYINYNILSKSIVEIEKYINETTKKEEFLSLKEDIEIFKNYIQKPISRGAAYSVSKNKQRQKYKLIRNTQQTNPNLNIINKKFLIQDFYIKYIGDKEIFPALLAENEILRKDFFTYMFTQLKDDSLKDEIIFDMVKSNFGYSTLSPLKKYNHTFAHKTFFSLEEYVKYTKEDETKKSIEIAIKKIFEEEK